MKHASPTRRALNLAVIAAITAPTLALASAVVPSSSSKSTTQSLFIESDVNTTISSHNGVVTGDANVWIAQSEPGTGNTKRVQVFTTGAGELTGLNDMDVVVSSALSNAFSSSGAGFGVKSVKNAPYAAEVISERVQKLPDGNEIVKRTSTMSYRDSAGRTRQETRGSKNELRSISIHDAIDGARYTLNPETKIANKIAMDAQFKKRIDEIRERAKAQAKDGKALLIERSNPGEEIIVERKEGVNADGKKELREEVKVSVIRSSSGDGNPVVIQKAGNRHDGTAGLAGLGDLSRLSPLGAAFQDSQWAKNATTQQLGVRDFEGVRAEGKTVSYTIPAGAVGNRNPITVSTESWYSPELQATVYSKQSDPRSGDTIYRMANIKRGEQPIALFVIPDGYSVKEMPGFNYQFRTENK